MVLFSLVSKALAYILLGLFFTAGFLAYKQESINDTQMHIVSFSAFVLGVAIWL